MWLGCHGYIFVTTTWHLPSPMVFMQWNEIQSLQSNNQQNNEVHCYLDDKQIVVWLPRYLFPKQNLSTKKNVESKVSSNIMNTASILLRLTWNNNLLYSLCKAYLTYFINSSTNKKVSLFIPFKCKHRSLVFLQSCN